MYSEVRKCKIRVASANIIQPLLWLHDDNTDFNHILFFHRTCLLQCTSWMVLKE